MLAEHMHFVEKIACACFVCAHICNTILAIVNGCCSTSTCMYNVVCA